MSLNLREIPENAVEIQTGLWAVARTISYGSIVRTAHTLYSAEGYCFYIISANIDEEGNLLPENERVYTRFASTAYQTIEQINKNVVSVPIKDGYEIANAGNSTVVE